MNRTLTLILVVLLAIAWLLTGGGCKRCDVFGGTQESKDKPYRGDPAQAGPHQTVVKKLWILPGQCDNTGCTYFVTVTVWLHNPTAKAVTGDVTCHLKFDGGSHTDGDTTVSSDYTASTNSRKGVTVQPGSSKEVKIQHNVSASRPTELVPDCNTVFR